MKVINHVTLKIGNKSPSSSSARYYKAITVISCDLRSRALCTSVIFAAWSLYRFEASWDRLCSFYVTWLTWVKSNMCRSRTGAVTISCARTLPLMRCTDGNFPKQLINYIQLFFSIFKIRRGFGVLGLSFFPKVAPFTPALFPKLLGSLDFKPRTFETGWTQ